MRPADYTHVKMGAVEIVRVLPYNEVMVRSKATGSIARVKWSTLQVLSHGDNSNRR